MGDLPSWVRVGAKCVCIKVLPSSHATLHLEVGAKYVVRDIFADFAVCEIAVEGLVNDTGRGPYWFVSQFEPLVDGSDEARERDVALFSHHLQAPHSSATRRAPVEGVDG